VDTQDGDVIGALVEEYSRPVVIVLPQFDKIEVYHESEFEILPNSQSSLSNAVFSESPIMILVTPSHFDALSLSDL
jgi:hypothetical protein